MANDEKGKVPAYSYKDADSMNLVSSTECTGLISARPDDEEDALNYSEMYDIPVNEAIKGSTDEN